MVIVEEKTVYWRDTDSANMLVWKEGRKKYKVFSNIISGFEMEGREMEEKTEEGRGSWDVHFGLKQGKKE